MKRPGDGEADLGAGEARPALSLTGTLKWFDMLRGYGFFLPDDGGGDVLIHYSIADSATVRALQPGARVTALVRDGARGRQAVTLLSVEPAGEMPGPPPAPVGLPDPLPAGFQPAQVRWFNRARGYGFLLLEDGYTQAFVHMETVRRAGYETLQPGQPLAARVETGPKGVLAVEILPASGSRA